MSTDKDKEEVVAIERLELSDDEDDNFKYPKLNILVVMTELQKILMI